MNNGFTAYIVFGKYAGFGVRQDGRYLRLVLGWVSLSAGFSDFERDVGQMVEAATADRNELLKHREAYKKYKEAHEILTVKYKVENRLRLEAEAKNEQLEHELEGQVREVKRYKKLYSDTKLELDKVQRVH